MKVLQMLLRLSPADGPDLDDVALRTAALVRVPRELQEDFRVLRYQPGQQFGAHTDYYEPSDFQEQPEVSRNFVAVRVFA